LEEASRVIYEGEIIKHVQKMGENLCFSTYKGFVYCLDGAKHEILWKFQAHDSISNSPFLGQERLYVFDRTNTLYGLDRKGKVLWEKKIEESISSEVRENQEKVYFGTEEGEFFALSASSGEELWRFKAGGPVSAAAAFFGNLIVFGSDEGKLYFLDQKGRLQETLEVGSKIQVAPLLDGNCLYFSSDDHYFHCFDLNKRKRRWKIKTGGKAFVSPVASEKRIFFLGSNSVLYCLNKKNGELLWWKAIPSRSFYDLEIIGERIVASSLSPVLVCFDLKTGEEKGKYEASQEIKSNPLWFPPYLLINLYDFQKKEGSLVFLKKEIKVFLTPSLQPPQKMGQEISFSASAVGFYRPKFEFYLKRGEKKEVVQKESEKNSWIWFPEREGAYRVGVKISDEKEMAEAEIAFEITKNCP
jgi:outer membrane protein assembly factor BamB